MQLEKIMKTSFELTAEFRETHGNGASRRLRRAGKVPAVLYGGQGGPRSITLDHQQLLTLIDKEKFYSSIISVNVDAQPQPAIVRDVQMHPAKNAVVHVDLQRVVESEKLRIHLPIHFKGEAVAPGVKTQGGIVSHLMQDVEISCLPADLPDFLELDLSAMNLNETRLLGDIPLPAGVSIPELAHRNPPVVSVHSPRAAEPEPEAVAAVTEVAAAAAVPAAADAAKKEEPKKEEAKKDAAPAKKEGGKK
jgi:large subunit ribosomal protein L25